MRLIVDVDGVLADFVLGAKCKYGINDVVWPPGCYDICEVFGMNPTDFWSGLDVNFWENLPPTPEYSELITIMDQHDTCILTSPTWNPASIVGKILWIQKWLPYYIQKRKFLIGPAKNFCAAPDHVLLDDSDVNVEEFRKYGGRAILVPRRWNSAYAKENNVIDVIRKGLLKL